MSSYASNVVPKECEGMRLDAYMASQGLYPTRSAAAKCIADSYCALNGKLPRKVRRFARAMCLTTRRMKTRMRPRARRGRYSARHSL